MASRDTVKTIYETIVKGDKKLDALTNKNKRYAKSAQEANKASMQSEKSFIGLKNAVATYVSIDLARRVAEQAIELGRFGAKVELVNKNFNNFAVSFGRDSDSMMRDLRKATQNMISDVELQQFAMQSMVSGVAFEDMITAMEFVSKQATATGANVAQKMQTVMTGFARGSAMFLDDVGIQVMGAEDVVSAAVEQMKQKMDLFSDATGTAAGNIASAEVSMENLRAEISQKLAPVTEEYTRILIELMNTFTETEGVEQFADIMMSTMKIVGVSILGVKTAAEIAAFAVESNFNNTEIAIKASIAGILDATQVMLAGIDRVQGLVTGKSFKLRSELKRNAASLRDDVRGLVQENKDAGFDLVESMANNGEAISEIWSGINTQIANTGKTISKITMPSGFDPKTKNGTQRVEDREAEFTAAINAAALERANKQIELWQLEYDYKQGLIAQEQQERMMALEEFKSSSISAISSISNARSSKKKKELNEELERIDKLNVSEKKKEKLRLKAEEEYQESQKRSAKIAFTINTILAQQDTIRAAISTLADTKGGPVTKILAAGAITAVAAGYFAGMSAINNKFFNGGEVTSNGRSGDSQLALVRSGERVLTPAENREYKVFQRTQGVNNTTNNNGNSYNINVSVQGGGSNQELTAMLTSALPEALERGVKTGDIDLPRMGIVTV